MDFLETPEEAEFRKEVIAFLEEHAPSPADTDDTSAMFITDAEDENVYVEKCKAWQSLKLSHGWAGLTWPEEYGGKALSGIFDGIFKEEESKRCLATGVFAVSIGMAGPAIINHGTEEQKRKFLKPMLNGDTVWCQLFSEPNAGSDLGGLRTTAVKDGNEWVVNGQKVWTSGAQYSDWGILLTRSDMDAPKHRGITYFLVDMKTPGVEVRPLVQITGAAHFNEVFLSDVRIPEENILGEPHAGWGPIMTTLAHERSMIGSGSGRTEAWELVELAKSCDMSEDLNVRQGIAQTYIKGEIMKYLGYRVRTASSKGIQPGPESSIMKLALSLNTHEMNNLTLSILGASGMLEGSDATDGGRWSQNFLGQWGLRIGGGTDDIQRNTIGEKVLMLPGDIRVDKNIPFKDIKF